VPRVTSETLVVALYDHPASGRSRPPLQRLDGAIELGFDIWARLAHVRVEDAVALADRVFDAPVGRGTGRAKARADARQAADDEFRPVGVADAASDLGRTVGVPLGPQVILRKAALERDDAEEDVDLRNAFR
jgi:hypothetical protein